MPGRKTSATIDAAQKAKESSLDSSSTAQAFVLHRIQLREESNRQDFELFMLKEVFPGVDTRRDNDKDMAADQHYLLGTGDGYVWMIKMEYFVHHAPLPNWLRNRAEESVAGVKDKIEPFASLTGTELLYDVKEWHQRLGVS